MKYYLFLDECGDPSLSTFNPTFPIFTLCGILVSHDNLKKIEESIKTLKKELWGEKKIILHSRDIRKCEKGFEVLFDLEKKRAFYERLNAVLGADTYSIITCSILKEPYIRKYGRLTDVYALSLSFIMERAVFYMDDVAKNESVQLKTIIEKRGKKEDKALSAFYDALLSKGTYWVTPERIKNYFKEFEMRAKKEDVIGLQIADLVAYPITRYIMDEDVYNPAYEIVKNNIYKKGEKMYGLKVFP